VTPHVSVLLISWNTRDEIRRCLESLYDTAGELSYEVIAVDNASADGSAELLAADPRVRLIRNVSNVGFAAAVNQAYRAASGELILLLNSDVQLHKETLAGMVGFLGANPDAAGVSPLYLNPDGTFQQHYVQLPGLAASIALFTMLRRAPGFRRALYRFQLRGEDFSKPRPLASGSCLLLRSTVLSPDQIFDESFPIFWNDAVLTRQLEAAGHQLWMIPDVAVTHTRGASCRLLGPAMGSRHLLGGLVGFLDLTRPRYQLAIFRAALLANYALKTLAGRTTTLGLADLLAALRGDVGPLPSGDTRDWVVVVGTKQFLTDQAAGLRPSVTEGEVRLLLVDPPGAGAIWRTTVRTVASGVWRLTMPTALPFGRQLAPVVWINGRVGAAALRRFLDRHAGARTLRVDRANRQLAGWLGEDIAATVEPVRTELSHV
jgi:GT2 family glycosyltransferase